MNAVKLKPRQPNELTDSLPKTSKDRRGVIFAIDDNGNTIDARTYVKDENPVYCGICLNETDNKENSRVDFVSPKTNIVKHFRHRSDVIHNSETLWHWNAKHLLASLYVNDDVTVEIEKSLNNRTSIADILFTVKPNHLVAIEVQYSKQQNELFLDRIERYQMNLEKAFCQWLYHPENPQIHINADEPLGALVFGTHHESIGFIVNKLSNGKHVLASHEKEMLRFSQYVEPEKYAISFPVDQWKMTKYGIVPILGTDAYNKLENLQDERLRVLTKIEEQKKREEEFEREALERELFKEKQRLEREAADWEESIRRESALVEWEIGQAEILAEIEREKEAERLSREQQKEKQIEGRKRRDRERIQQSLDQGLPVVPVVEVKEKDKSFNGIPYFTGSGFTPRTHLQDFTVNKLPEWGELLECLGGESYQSEDDAYVVQYIGRYYCPEKQYAAFSDSEFAECYGVKLADVSYILAESLKYSDVWEVDETQYHIGNGTRVGRLQFKLQDDFAENNGLNDPAACGACRTPYPHVPCGLSQYEKFQQRIPRQMENR